MNRERMIRYRITAILLCFIMVFTSLPAMAFAEEPEAGNRSEEPDANDMNVVYEETSLSDTLILEEEVSAENAVLEESTETTTIFDLGYGKKVAIFHGGDVRYQDEEGNLTDYDPKLVSLRDEKSMNGEALDGYRYENKNGDMKQYIPSVIDEDTPLLMEKDRYAIRMTPVDENLQDQKVRLEKDELLTPYEEIRSEDLTAVYTAEDAGYSYEYTSLTNGIKESIVLEEKPESNVFLFRLDLDGLVPELDEKENIIHLKDSRSRETVASVDKPFMNDATGEAYSENLSYAIAENGDGSYQVTLTAGKKYLNSAERIYPVTIDPTTTWKGNSELADAYVISGDYADTNFYDSDVRLMVAGKGAEGTYRTYIKILSLKATLEDKYVDSAYLTVYESGDCDADQTIRFNRILESWTASTLTWNNKPQYNTEASINSFTTDGTQYAAHKMKMTNTVRNYVNSTDNPNYGIVMRNVTSSPGFAEFYGSRTTLTSYRPKLVVTYYDKPTKAATLSLSRYNTTTEEYVETQYMRPNKSFYASWTDIKSHNLEDVQYKIIGVNGTDQPTSIGSSEVDLTAYRSIGTVAEDGTNVKVSYGASLPAGTYRLYLRGKDAGGMYGTAKYIKFYVDDADPELTNVRVAPDASVTATNNVRPTISWNVSDQYFSYLKIRVNGTTKKTISKEDTTSWTPGSDLFSKSGAYKIKVTAYDKSGNYTSSEEIVYNVDLSEPVIKLTLSPQSEKSSPVDSQTPKLSWEITETNLKDAVITLSSGEEQIWTKTVTEKTGSVTFTEDQFPSTGTYTIQMKATDDIGNVGTSTARYYLDLEQPLFENIRVWPGSTEGSPSGICGMRISWDASVAGFGNVYYSANRVSSVDAGDDGVIIIPSTAIEEGENEILLELTNASGKVVDTESLIFYYEEADSTAPEILDVTEYYGKRIIRWDMENYNPGKVAYDLYRGTSANFTPSVETLVEADIDGLTGMYMDKEILPAGTYYYKIVANFSANTEDEVSNTVSITNGVTADSFAKTNGFKDYLEYLEMGLPIGTMYVEKKSGNLVYTQDDFDLSGNHLDYGMSRTYNSKDQRTSMIGTGWNDSYHKEIYTDGADIYFVDADGSSYCFVHQTGNTYTCEEAPAYTLTAEDEAYTLTESGGATYTFNASGQLKRITEPNGSSVLNRYDEKGRLKNVRHFELAAEPVQLTFSYDNQSMLLESVTNPEETEYLYSHSGSLLTRTKISEDGLLGDSVSFDYAYSEDGLLNQVVDGENNAYTATYSGGKVSTVAYPDQESFNLTYEGNTTILQRKTADGTEMYTQSVTFDASSGNIKTVISPGGNVTTYVYGDDRHPHLATSVTETSDYQTITGGTISLGTDNHTFTTTYTYDEKGNVTAESCSDGSVTNYTYDDGNRILTETTVKTKDGVSVETTDMRYVYDADGNMTAMVDRVNHTAETYIYEEGMEVSSLSFENINDTEGDMEAELLVDDDDILTSETTTAVSVDLETRETKIETVSTSGGSTDKVNTISDVMGNTTSVQTLTTETEAVSSQTDGAYDYLGRMTESETRESGKEAVTTTNEYDDNGSLITESTTDGTTSAYEYDTRNRCEKVTTSGSGLADAVTATGYSFAKNLVVNDGLSTRTESFVYIETETDAVGLTTTSYIDVEGNTVKTIVDEDTFVDYTYDKAGNQIVAFTSSSDGSLKDIVLNLYDSDGNAFATVRQPEVFDGKYVIGEATIVTYTNYDDRGNVASETDGMGVVTTFKYDEKGRLENCDIAGDGNDITVSYTPEGQNWLTTVTDAKGNLKMETTDAKGATTQITDSDAAESVQITVEYTYDKMGRKIQEDYGDKTYIAYEYENESERIAKQISYRADGSVEKTVTYTYDNKGRVISAVSVTGTDTVTESWDYDTAGRMTSFTQSHGGTEVVTRYSYDAAGRLVSTAYPSISGLDTIAYTYDSQGRVSLVRSGDSTVREYGYDGLNRVTTVKDYKNPGESAYILTVYAYDALGRTSSITYTNGADGTVLESFAYTYDKNNQITQMRHVNNLPADGKKIDETRDYLYDSYGRLTQSTKTNHLASDAQSVTTYGYDSVGNRISQNADGNVTDYSYNGLNQLTKAETDSEEITYAYDQRGNQVSEISTDETSTACTFAVTGEMLSVTQTDASGNTSIQQNVYNYAGTRVFKTEGGTTRSYFYDNGLVAFTLDGDALSSANVLSDSGKVIGSYRGDAYHVYLEDAQGSMYSIVKQDGSLSAAYSYSDFGETEEITGGSFDNEICYTGAVYDKSTGLYYLNARYYNPETGRFVSQDSYRGSVDNPRQWNLYNYCNNNPINYTDLSGHTDLFIGYWSDKQHYFAYNQNAPQKYLGYYDIYDYAANYFGMNIGHFKRATKNWKLEFWKGQYGKMYGYGISSGCEIGLYYKSGSLWKCAYQKSRRLRMKMTLYKKGYSQKMFTRDSKTSTVQGKAWWLTAFQPENYMPGKKTAPPEKLKMTGTIWFDSCNQKYHAGMKSLSKLFASGTTYQNKWGNFYVHDSSTWRKKVFTWKYKS